MVLWLLFFKILKKYWKSILYAMFFALLFSIPWDILALRNQIWYFPKEGNLGILISGLPVEEFLFMTLFTLYVATVTIVFKYRIKKNVW